MLYWILQITLISIIFILLVHHIFQFLKNTLTVPKIKDLVNVPTKKYENMYRVINQGTTSAESSTSESSTPIFTLSREDLLPKDSGSSMKDELKNFLKNQMM